MRYGRSSWWLLPGIKENPAGSGKFIFTGAGKSKEYAQKVCADSGGLHCIYAVGYADSCSASKYPTVCNYSSSSAVECKDNTGKIQKFSTVSTKIDNNTEICGDKNAPPAKCEKRPVNTTGGSGFGLDMTIDICSNIPTPKFVVAESNLKMRAKV